MNVVKIISIILLISGIIVFVGGIIILWRSEPPYGWASVLIFIGILFLLGANITLCIGQQPEQFSSTKIKEVE